MAIWVQAISSSAARRGRSRESFCSRMTVLDMRVLEQRIAAVPTAKFVNVDFLRAKLAEAAAERDNFRGWK